MQYITLNNGVKMPQLGYGALEFASDRDQRKHPAFILVPQYTTWTVGEGAVNSDEVEMTILLLQYVCKEYKVDQKTTIHNWPINGWHDVVLFQHRPS